jgi:hypothetical protein
MEPALLPSVKRVPGPADSGWLRAALDDGANHRPLAQLVAHTIGVLHVLLKAVVGVQHGSNAALGVVGGAVAEGCPW